MSNLEHETYTLFISSDDKVSGTNNDAIFDINWDDFLPRKYQSYKVVFSFQTSGGAYKDFIDGSNLFNTARVVMDTYGKTFSYDTKTKSSSTTLGYIHRDPQVYTVAADPGTGTNTSSNTLSCFYLQNVPKTISRPNQNQINIIIYNASTTDVTTGLLVDTSIISNVETAGADMTSWQMIMEFIPIIKHDNITT
jgi:hypothetical protein